MIYMRHFSQVFVPSLLWKWFNLIQNIWFIINLMCLIYHRFKLVVVKVHGHPFLDLWSFTNIGQCHWHLGTSCFFGLIIYLKLGSLWPSTFENQFCIFSDFPPVFGRRSGARATGKQSAKIVTLGNINLVRARIFIQYF